MTEEKRPGNGPEDGTPQNAADDRVSEAAEALVAAETQALKETLDPAEAAVQMSSALATEKVTDAMAADIRTAKPGSTGLSETTQALVECLAEVNEGSARSVAAIRASRDALDGKDVDLDAHQRRLEEQRDAIDGALSKLPENRAYLDSVGKDSVAELDEGGKRGLYVHLRRRLIEAVAEGFCKDKGVASVDELSDEDRAELTRRQEEEEKKWK